MFLRQRPARALHFLGTAGARHVVANQLRHSGGLFWQLPGVGLWADPGPGALVRALSAQPAVDPASVDVLFLSHRHLDHTGDANAVIEAMSQGGTRRRGTLFAPDDALRVEPVVYSYARAFVADVQRTRAGASFSLAPGVSLSTPIAHRHGVETYGYCLSLPGLRAAHIIDTAWFDGLSAAYAGADLLLVNTTLPKRGHSNSLHLAVPDAEALVRAIRPKLTILTHLGRQVLQADPARLAREVAGKTGLPVIAATDGMIVSLDDLSVQP